MADDPTLAAKSEPPAIGLLQVNVEYDEHLANSWRVSQAIWEEEEEERRQRRVAASEVRARSTRDALADMNDSLVPPTPPPSPSLDPILFGTLSDCPLSEDSTPEPMASTDSPGSAPDRPKIELSIPTRPFVPSELSPLTDISDDYPGPRTHASSPDSSLSSASSDAYSQPDGGSKKRRRRENWSQEKLEREKRRLKEKEKRRRAEGKVRPRKRSQVQKDRKKARRAEMREMGEMGEGDDEGPTPFGYRLPKNALRKWAAPIVIPTTYGMEDAPKVVRSSRGMGTPHAIVDPKGRLLGVLAGRPDDPNWEQDVLVPATALLEEIRAEGDTSGAWSTKQLNARRGDFVSITSGVSYGGGQDHPGNLAQEKVCQVPYVGRLLRSKPIRRMAGFANSAFHTYSPKMYKYYATETDALYKHDPTCKPPFKNAVWPACTFNLGPSTCCLGHCDSQNLPQGWCAIWSMGRYDSKLGGHLVLEEFNLIVEFPPGSLILIPSSTIRHGNTPVKPHERRYSFTMYCAGGLMRWIHHGFVPEWSLTDEARKEAYGEKGERWREALDMYSVYKDLRNDHRACCGAVESDDEGSEGVEEEGVSEDV